MPLCISHDFTKQLIPPPEGAPGCTCFYRVGKHLVLGELKFGGNSIVFQENPLMRLSELVVDWYQTTASVKLLAECVRSVHVKRGSQPSVVQFLRSLRKAGKCYQTENTSNLVKGGKKQRGLDLEAVQLFAKSAQEVQQFCETCAELTVGTFDKSRFTFVLKEADAVLVQLKEFLNISETIVPGGEDFDFTVLQPGFDQSRLSKVAGSQNAVSRAAVTYLKKTPEAKNMLVSQKKLEKELAGKRLLTCKPKFPKSKVPASPVHNKVGNLQDDRYIQCLTANDDNDSESDLAISCDMIFEITARHTSHTSIETNSDQSLTCDSSIGSDIQNMLSASQSQKMQKSQFALEALYLGRKSQILNDILSIRLQMFLPKMVSRLSMFVQFTSKFDGKHLHNLYNSFKPHAINFDQDRQKYNMHIDMSRTKFSQTSLILVKATDQVFGFGFTGELKSTTTTFQNLFVFNLSENKQYAAKKEVLVRMFDRLIVGASGSAIVLHKNLQKVYTSASESFQSPELFRGERYEQFVEAEIDCVEVIRFVF
ncbi:TLD_family protein [Hexamita inflata]|uniref:TLD family protein n=1 Tax=Hexamita inflata TaxID=28002 RepID=A0AA86PRS2_9EUKA|nr:TLD family protein [Hexamita inflata]